MKKHKDVGHKPQARLLWLDAWRGGAVVAMVVYHFLYDLRHIAGIKMPWFHSYGVFLFQQGIGLSFITIAGMSFFLSQRSKKSIWQVALAALLVSVVTSVVMPQEQIIFGVLHALAAMMVIVRLIFPVLRHLQPRRGCFVAGTLFIVFWWLGQHPETIDPRVLLFWQQVPFHFMLGFPAPGFFSSDYYPLLPWFFAFLGGFFYMMHKDKQSHLARGITSPKVLVTIGQHALVIYLLHQPLLLLLLQLGNG